MALEKINHQIGVGDVEVPEIAKQYIKDILEKKRLTYGPYLKAYEKEFAKAHNAKFAVAVNSGTDALRIAVGILKEANNWNDSDEIICPASTFIASSNVILQNNLKPVFIDADPRTYNLDHSKLEELITDKTKAVMVVHLYGQPCEMDPIAETAKKHNLKIIEDSCETMFVKYKNKYVGNFGDIACFSSYACHIISTGVGGIAVTNNPDLAVGLRSLANHGRDSIYISIDDDKTDSKEKLQEIVEKRFKFVRIGYSSRITEFEGALGLAQLQMKDQIIKKRKENADFFINHLKKYENHLQLPYHPEHIEHAFMMFPLVVKSNKFSKQDLVMFLETNNIETRDMLTVINQPVYIKLFGNLEDKYPVTKIVNKTGFYIGCQPQLTGHEKEYIISKFDEFFESISKNQDKK